MGADKMIKILPVLRENFSGSVLVLEDLKTICDMIQPKKKQWKYLFKLSITIPIDPIECNPG